MKNDAPHLLEKLFNDEELFRVGERKTPAVLTNRDLEEYQRSKSLSECDAFEAKLLDAEKQGAIRLTWSPPIARTSPILRVELVDLTILASIMGRELRSEVLQKVMVDVEPLLLEHPVIGELINRYWRRYATYRNLSMSKFNELRDAAIVVNKYRELQTKNLSFDAPLRVVSQHLFPLLSRDATKRIESLVPAIDLLLQGSLEGESRKPEEVYQELGLYKEEQPVFLAGLVSIKRSRHTTLLDSPYSAFHAPSVLELATVPKFILSIENLTTFHIEAKNYQDQSVLILYTAGVPSPKWRAMYQRLLTNLPQHVPIYHWGDIDEGGFRIASMVSEVAKTTGHALQPWEKMKPDQIPQGSALKKNASDQTVRQMVKYAERAGWQDIAAACLMTKFTAEQEALSDNGFNDFL